MAGEHLDEAKLDNYYGVVRNTHTHTHTTVALGPSFVVDLRENHLSVALYL